MEPVYASGLLASAQLAEVLGHRVSITCRNLVSGAAADLSIALFLGLPPQLDFQGFQIRQNGPVQALLQFWTRRVSRFQALHFALQIGDLLQDIRVVFELHAQFGKLPRRVPRDLTGVGCAKLVRNVVGSLLIESPVAEPWIVASAIGAAEAVAGVDLSVIIPAADPACTALISRLIPPGLITALLALTCCPWPCWP